MANKKVKVRLFEGGKAPQSKMVIGMTVMYVLQV